jgi:hypothetical protein
LRQTEQRKRARPYGGGFFGSHGVENSNSISLA